MSLEFFRAIGFTLWVVAGLMVVLELLLHRRMVSYIRENYPEGAKVGVYWWWLDKKKVLRATPELKQDPTFKRLSRQTVTLSVATFIVALAAANLSDRDFIF